MALCSNKYAHPQEYIKEEFNLPNYIQQCVIYIKSVILVYFLDAFVAKKLASKTQHPKQIKEYQEFETLIIVRIVIHK